MQGSSTTSVLLKWVRHSQFLKGNIFQFQGNLTWWTNTSSLVSFLQDKKKLKFVNKTHSKLKIQLSGTEPKCRPIITGFEHQPYSSTCSQLVPISLLCVEKRSAGSLHEVQSTCWRFSKAHCSSLLHTSLSFTSHQWRCLNTWQWPLTPSQWCSAGDWLLQLLEAALPLPLEPHLHSLSLKVSLTWGTATPSAPEGSTVRQASVSPLRKQKTAQVCIYRDPRAPILQHDPGRASATAMSPNNHSSVPASVRIFYSALKSYNRDTLALVRAAQAISPTPEAWTSQLPSHQPTLTAVLVSLLHGTVWINRKVAFIS